MKKHLLFLVLFIMFPTNILAYSEKVILGGENIGIHIDTPGIMIIGFYRVNGEYINSSNDLKIGDYITMVNNTPVNTIDELTSALEKENNNGTVTLKVKRNNNYIDTTINMSLQDNIYKSGLYVKDSITGLGTLTYIDPETRVFGALGHEIQESNSLKRVEIKEGFIFESTVTNIRKSRKGYAGEKNANYKMNHLFGSIEDNNLKGIYGIYKEEITGREVEVANEFEINTGKAEIYTVIEGNNKEVYNIEIDNINENSINKNISFRVTDNKLIEKSGGIIQGMSGSPIVQNGKIIGAVTHVIVENPERGYGIFIRNMLEEGDKIKTTN